MYLLCTLAWSLILLPLGFCCKGQKQVIAGDYSSIIQVLIKDILDATVTKLNGTCRPVNRTELRNVSIQKLNTVVCRHSQPEFCDMNEKVEILTKEILSSLQCSCKDKAEKKKPQLGGNSCQLRSHLHRKLCTLKHWLERIQHLYTQFNST